MVVEQEMAEIYPSDPEDLCEFLPETDCTKCGYPSCMEFAAVFEKRRSTLISALIWTANLPNC